MRKKRGLRADTLVQSVSVAIALAIVCRFVAFGRGVYLARVFEPEQLGTWALMANAIQVLAFICALGIPNGLARYSERHRAAGTLSRFYLGALARSLAVVSVVCLIGVVFWQTTGRLLFAEAASGPMVWITLAAVLVTVLLMMAQGMLHGLRLFRVNSLFDLGQNLTFLMLAILLLGLWRNDAYAAAWANLLATLLIAAAIGWWLRRALGSAQVDEPPTKLDSVRWRTMLIFSLGAWSAGSCQALWRVIDRYMLLHLSALETSETLDHIGQYFIASKLGQPLGVLAGVLSMALLPHAVKMWEGNRRAEVARLIRSTAKLSAMAMTFGGAVLIVLAPWLIELVTGRTAALAGAVFVPVLVAIIAVSLHYILRTYLMCDERAWSVGGVWLAVLLGNAALNAVLIPKYGLMGAAWATMFSAAVAVGLVVVLSARSGMRIGRRLVFSLLVPAALLLPTMPMLVALTCIVGAVQFSELVFSNAEKNSFNRWCAERVGPYCVGRVGRILAPRPS